MIESLSVAAVMPALDEEGVIGSTLASLPRDIIDDVWVVDNGSADGTAAEAAAAGARVVVEPRRGYGIACQAALIAMRHEPPHVVVFIDADGSQPLDETASLLRPIVQDGADFVIGIRRFGDTPVHVTLGNRLACMILASLTGHKFRDLGPFRAIRFAALRDLELRDPDYGWNIEMQARALACGLRIVEVPVSHRPRLAGRSKISGSLKGTVGAGTKILWSSFRHGWEARRSLRG
ncbi:MAG: glycosyltransferase family 2 protein [Gemmatimonadales bacterium]